MEDSDPFVGEKIRQLREKVGWSIRELARRAEVDFTNLSRIERGENRPTVHTLLKLSDALGIQFGVLFGHQVVDPPLPEPRAYFRQKFGVDVDEAEILARLIEDHQARQRKQGGENHEETDQG